VAAFQQRFRQAAPIGEHDIGDDPAGIFALLDVLEPDRALYLRLDPLARRLAQPAFGRAGGPEDLGRVDPGQPDADLHLLADPDARAHLDRVAIDHAHQLCRDRPRQGRIAARRCRQEREEPRAAKPFGPCPVHACKFHIFTICSKPECHDPARQSTPRCVGWNSQ